MGRFYAGLLILILIIPRAGMSQTMDCEQTIAYATEEFNAGHFYSIPGILNDCIKSFSREQKQRAFLLLTQTYLLLDDPIGAERSYLEILWANPEFVADEQLHAIDIVYLSKRFTATPRFSWFVGAGPNVSPVRVIRDLTIARNESERYTLRAGYHAGVGGEYSYDDHFRLRLEVNYLHTTYRSEIVNYFEFDRKQFFDRQSWFNIPLYVSYADHIGKYRPYGYAGYSISGLLNDRASILLKKIEGIGDEQDIFEKQSPDLDFRDKRKSFNQSLIFGGGVRYKVGLDFVFAEVRYSVGLKNMVANIYADYSHEPTSPEIVRSMEPVAGYGHVDDYFRLDNLALTVGFLRPLYKPRELKRARTKGVLRKMNPMK